jgi:predicted DNA-binding transcriptional regulator AlpA
VSGALLRVDALADYLGQSVAWCRSRMADGTIPGARKIRGRWYARRADVEAWLAAGSPEREEPQGLPYRPPPRTISRTVDRAA